MRTVKRNWDKPHRCPECHRVCVRGDLARMLRFEHCPDCQVRWIGRTPLYAAWCRWLRLQRAWSNRGYWLLRKRRDLQDWWERTRD